MAFIYTYMLKNPYQNLEKTIRIMVDVSEPDYYLVKLIRPQQGTTAGVLGILWSSLCAELRKHGITDLTKSDDFERVVNSVRFSLGGNTSPGPLSEAHKPDDGLGAIRVPRDYTGDATVVSDVQGSHGTGRAKKRATTKGSR